MSRHSRLLPIILVVLGFAAYLAFVLLIILARTNGDIYLAPRADDDSHLPPLDAAAIQNNDFRVGFAHWETRHILADAQSEVTEFGQTLAFARLTKPAEWKIPTTMLQKLNVRRLDDNVRVRVAADFRIPRKGGPATILIECIDKDAPKTEATKYGLLLTSESSPTPADGEWHQQEVDFVAPRQTNQLLIFIKVAGDANVDLTRVTLKAKTER